MPRDVRALLEDLREALALLESFRAGRSFEDYTATPMLRSAIERQLEVVGEAVRQLRAIDPELASQITEAPRIIAFRNVLAHAYADVSDSVVWSILTDKLAELRNQVEHLLRNR